MSIPKRSRCGRILESAGRGAVGFTLIELLVVVAIIALLISILLPSLRNAREQARSVVCGQRLADFGKGLNTYATEEQDWIPGYNTSGVAMRALRLMFGVDASVMYRAELPVQSWDWMTPVLSRQLTLDPVRAKKWAFLLNEMRCPTQSVRSVIWDQGQSSPDEDLLYDAGPFFAVSYLMPANFQFVGQDHRETVLAYEEHPAVPGQPIKARAAPEGFETINYDYLPRIDRVGQPAQKIFVADGTRYLELQGGTEDLDFEAYPDPQWFGAFSDPGAWWCGSTAYGVEPGTQNWDGQTVSAGEYPPGRGRNLALSYRHGSTGTSITSSAQSNKGLINAVFFDGHVERMNDRRSRSIELWYPKGSVVQTPGEGMTYAEEGMTVP